MPSLTVLLAESEPIISMEIRQILEDQGHQVIQATALKDLLDACKQHQPSLAILNFKSREGGDGMQIAQYLTEQYMLPIMFITGAMPDEIKTSQYFNDTLGVLYKPFTPSQLRRLVNLVGSFDA
jgi:DNA-binding response OmpR family regulator